MSHFIKESLEVLSPAYYVPENDEQLQAHIQKISAQDALDTHALAVARAVYTIVLVAFVNIPYHFSKGTVNIFLNCVHLNFDRMVLGHYKVAIQSVLYSVIATMYVMIGIFFPSALNGFKIEVLPNRKEDSSDPNFPSIQEETIKSPAISIEMDFSSPLNQSEYGENVIGSLSNFVIEDSSLRSLDLRSFGTNFSSLTFNQRELVNEEELSQSIALSMNDWEIPDNQPFAIESIGVYDYEMIGSYGVNLERQAHRVALNEYVRILRDKFQINLDDTIFAINEWRKKAYQNDPMVNALYRTLLYLKYPVDPYNRSKPLYTNAKKQYKKYVVSLREIIATEQYKKMQKEAHLPKERKECLALIGALCEARFCSENHELLRQLLQLHENAYDRLYSKTEEIPSVTRENFVQVVMKKNRKVFDAPSEMKVSWSHQYSRMGYGALGLEDFLLTDIPFLRGEQVFINAEGKEKTFYYMRHPTPHIPSSTLNTLARICSLNYIKSAETIAPEFEGMLEAIAKRKEDYLIQSHQRLNDTKGICENEDTRSQTLYELQKSHSNFHVVFQAVEGDLFDRKGKYAEITTFVDLKKAIKDSFYEERSPNRLPYLLESDEFYRQEVLDTLLDQVHHVLFEGRMHISFNGLDPRQSKKPYPNREWQEFILAFYIFQGDDLKFRLPNVKYFCTNCKNFFDRGGNRAMAEDRMHQEMSGEVTREQLEETIVNLVPVPIQSKGKGVLEHRLPPGLALAETLTRLSAEKRQQLQKITFNGYKPDRFIIHKRPQQPAVPLIQDAHTLQEIKEVLKALQGKSRCLIDNAIVEKNWGVYQNDRAALFNQVDKDLLRISVCILDETLDDKQTKRVEIKNAEEIFAYVSKTTREETALIAMAQIQQGIFFEPWQGLLKAFQHAELCLEVMSGEDMAIDVKIEAADITITAQCCLKYRTTNPVNDSEEKPIAIFGVTVFVTVPKNGNAPSGHWTWEIKDISV